jgi:hypothetical protein
MNLLLLTTAIAEVCLVICLWYSPQLMRWLGAHLLTRADVIEASKDETQRRMDFWRNELGLEAPTCHQKHAHPVRQAS